MTGCTATRANGEPCKAAAMPGAAYCWAHDPSRAVERRRNASKGGKAGGRGRPGGAGELADVKTMLGELIDGVKDGSLEPGKVWAINALLNTKLRVIELERKQRELEDLEGRIAALEEAREGITKWR